MKPNELRIGNYINIEIHKCDGLELHEISELRRFTITDVNEHSFQYDSIEPVELTAEMALRLGFKRFESDGVVGFDTFEPEEKTIWYEIGKFTLVQWGENTEFYFSDNNLRILVKYVHKLQNLYFEHTGVELQLSST